MQPPNKPGVYIQETAQITQPIAAASTSTTAFVGVAANGPIDKAMPMASWTEFAATFGGLSPTSEMSYAVWQFFQNGGTDAVVVRVADVATDPATIHATLFPTSSPAGGVSALESTPFNVLVLPGITDAPTLRDAAAFCENNDAFLIVDPPPDSSPQAMQAYATSAVLPANVSHAALYYPYIVIADPLTGASRAVPPSGSVAGLYARNDAAHGVWKAPAGTTAALSGAVSVAYDVTDADDSLLNPIGVNTIRAFPGMGIVVWGARTLDAGSSDWMYVSTRRLASFIERSLMAGTKWVTFEPNGAALWTTLRVAVDVFLSALFHQGALAGSTPAEAYFVKCDIDTNPPASILNGFVNIEVGFAPLKPAEFIVITLQIAVQHS